MKYFAQTWPGSDIVLNPFRYLSLLEGDDPFFVTLPKVRTMLLVVLGGWLMVGGGLRPQAELERDWRSKRAGGTL